MLEETQKDAVQMQKRPWYRVTWWYGAHILDEIETPCETTMRIVKCWYELRMNKDRFRMESVEVEEFERA